MLVPLFISLSMRSVTDFTFVRHGETIANATGKYNSQTIDTFSKKGQEQVNRLTQDLMTETQYDVILVSPSPRALYTIAPYLKAKGKKAIVWPLLYECCTMKRPADAHATTFKFGFKIAVPGPIAAQFTVKASENRYPMPSDYNEGLAQVNASVAEFRKKYAGKRVLIVGHSGHGGQFIKALTGKTMRVDNASPIKLRF